MSVFQFHVPLMLFGVHAQVSLIRDAINAVTMVDENREPLWRFGGSASNLPDRTYDYEGCFFEPNRFVTEPHRFWKRFEPLILKDI